MQAKNNPKRFILPKSQASWHFERELKPDDKTIGNYVLIQPGAADIVKVTQAYFHHPVPGYNIASIEIVYNEQLNRVFYGNMKMMNVRKGNPKYMPEWKSAAFDVEKQQREATFQQFQNLSQPHADPDVPNMHLLPLWHGTNDDVAEYIFNMGYGIFATNLQFVTDEGYFGKGVYTAHEAEYSFRSYAKKHGAKAVLLLNWVSSFEAYPIIHGDMPKVQGKPIGFDNCDAHFIPVFSDRHPHTDIYYPCRPNQPHQYLEMVVFSPAQCLPRYKVKLVQSVPKLSIDDAALTAYQMGLDFLGLGQTMMVSQAFEQAHDMGHPAASVRLHWLYSGGSGLIPANPQELQKHSTLFNTSLAWLKQQANFRGNHHPESQFNLGWCYQHGLGVDQDLVKAAKYYWVAANQGHRDAQYQLGVCCASGIGIKQSMRRAIFYYGQAAEKGHIHAHYLLSQCYVSGFGIVQDAVKAAFHQQAAQKGNHPQLVGSLVINTEINYSEDKKTIQRLNEVIQQQQEELQQKESIKNIEIERYQQESIVQVQALAKKEIEISQLITEIGDLKLEVSKLENTLQISSRSALEISKIPQLKMEKNEGVLTKIVNPSGVLPSIFQSIPNQLFKLSEQVTEISNQAINQINHQDLSDLFIWVMNGDLPEAEKLLQKNPQLTLGVRKIKDLSNREFNNITVLQYAAWTLDIEMCELIIKYLNQIASLHVSIQLAALAYEPSYYSTYGAHYDLTTLMTKMQHYLNNYSNWNYEESCRFWQKEIGGEQRKCPAWLIYAWSEEGHNAGWAKKDFSQKINREYGKKPLLWWMNTEYNEGKGVGSDWAAVRGAESQCRCEASMVVALPKSQAKNSSGWSLFQKAARPPMVSGDVAHDREIIQFYQQARVKSLEELHKLHIRDEFSRKVI